MLLILFFITLFICSRLFPLIFRRDSGSESDSMIPVSTAVPTSATTAQTTHAATTTKPVPKDTDYVKVVDYIPTIYVELKYATDDNITGHVIYNYKDAYLRYGTVKKLIPVQNELLKAGYSMKIWDAYRTLEAQFALWKAKPNPAYIANPNRGYTSHNFGNTLDVTLVAADGSYIEVPSGFDNFTSKADRNYSDVTKEQAEHALLLQNAMIKYGFTPYQGEWWHFQDTVKYTFDKTFVPES